MKTKTMKPTRNEKKNEKTKASTTTTKMRYDQVSPTKPSMYTGNREGVGLFWRGGCGGGGLRTPVAAVARRAGTQMLPICMDGGS